MCAHVRISPFDGNVQKYIPPALKCVFYHFLHYLHFWLCKAMLPLTCRVTPVCDEHTEPSQTIRGHEIHFYMQCGLTLFHI